MTEERTGSTANTDHARHGFCQKCWDDAFMESMVNGQSQADNYRRILADSIATGTEEERP